MRRNLSRACLAVLLAAVAAGAGWNEFVSREGRFAIRMPGAPVRHSQTVDSDAGPIDMHMFSAEEGGMVYFVAYSDYPAGQIDAASARLFLDGARDGAIRNIKGTLLAETAIKQDRFPGRELKIASADGSMVIRARLFMIDARLLQVMVIAPAASLNDATIDRFFESLRLL
ncbi:MAG TPA: hypothetical protein VNL37_03675 [Candidatus Polarisedimenticolia bacterium]|nr:hypothetical protein [Candidatus Polarisedimenticolia bacterium]